jgi:acyl carrier protein
MQAGARATVLDAVAAGAASCGRQEGHGLDTQAQVIKVLEETLNLRPSGLRMTSDSPLLGAIPELDSMAVVAVITTLEEHFGFVVADDEIDGSAFATVGSLVEFVKSKLGA